MDEQSWRVSWLYELRNEEVAVPERLRWKSHDVAQLYAELKCPRNAIGYRIEKVPSDSAGESNE